LALTNAGSDTHAGVVPGNVRQLENSMERAVALTYAERIQVEDLQERVAQFDPTGRIAEDVDLEHLLTLEQVERRQIERVIRQHHGNKTRAAKALGIDRRTLYRKLERYDGSPRLPTPPINGSPQV
jgi:two-component system, NtrC family, response regulator AtoC